MTKSLRIVLIEDNPVDCARVVQLLEREFADLSVRQIREAVDLDAVVAEGDFDLVLTDYLLPWTDGLAVLRAVKRRWPDVPVLMVTGSGNEEIAIEAIKSGLDDYILKSHKHLARLPAAIRTALERLEQRHRLEEAEVQYHTLFDRMPIGLYRTTARGEFLDVNSALIEMLGYPDRESLLAVGATSLYADPEDQAVWRQMAERAGTVRDFEFRVRRRDGAYIWVRNTARVIYGAGRCVLGYEGSIEDVSERKWAEEVLAERTRQLEAVREAGSEITHELELSTVLGLILRRAAELVGAAGGSVYLWDDATRHLVARARLGLGEWLDDVRLRPGEGVAGTVAARGEGLIVNDYRNSPLARSPFLDHSLATALIAEPLLYRDRILGVMLFSNEGAARRFTPSDSEILKLFAAPAAVAIENARLFGEVTQAKMEWENTFDAAVDMIAVLDNDYRILRANQALARRLGMMPGQIIGRHCYDLFEGCPGRDSGCGFARCVESLRPATEERAIPRTGEVLLQTYSPILNAQGQLAGVVQLSKDVTAHRQLQQQFAHSEKMAALGRLISGVAHELNNPLTGIFGNAQLLMLETRDEETQQRAEVIAGEAERAAKIVRNLLAFARPYRPERRPVRLSTLIEETLALRRYELSVRNIALLVELAPDLPLVLADPHQIQQVLLNLFINAEQAIGGGAGAAIQIGAKPTATRDQVTVRVADNGPGMPPEVVEKVFDPFFTTKKAGQGTGLGLAICYAIVQEHRGRIRAGNRAEGGAWFEFDLPTHAGSATPPAESSAKATPVGVDRGLRILVIDDEDAIGRVVSGALTMVGHQVEVVRDGWQAAEWLRQREYDLVFLDMKMPGIDGKQLYDDVICRKPLPPRVIIMTGDTISQESRAFLERTGLKCVEKPFALESIWDCVRVPGAPPSGTAAGEDTSPLSGD